MSLPRKLRCPKQRQKPLHQPPEAQRMPNLISLPTEVLSSTNSKAPQKPMQHLHTAQGMPIFMRLPTEIRLMVYEYLLPEEVQPTTCKYPRNIPKQIREEAFPVYLSSNNIIFDSSRAACRWLEHISPYLSKQNQSLHLTFDLRHDYSHGGPPVAKKNTRKADQKRFFRLLATTRAKLDLTIKAGGHLIGEMSKCGALTLMHGFASATSTPAPAVNSRCEAHRHLHQFPRHIQDRRTVADAVAVAQRRVTAIRPLLDRFTSACPTGCEHLANGGGNGESSIHIDVRGVRCGSLMKCDATNCLICFAKGV